MTALAVTRPSISTDLKSLEGLIRIARQRLIQLGDIYGPSDGLESLSRLGPLD
jgi:hypothetical protein